MDNIFEKYYKIYLVGLFTILVLPIVNIQPWLSPPAWGKAIIFRIILLFFIYLFFQTIISKKKYKIFLELKNNILVLLLGVLGVLYILATIFSQNPHFSFWGSPLRAGGSLNYILYIFFAVLTFLIVKKQDWQKLWDFTLTIGVFVTLIAFFQKISFFSSIIIPRTDRALGTIGGPTFLGLYLLLLIFLALSFGIETKGQKRLFYFFCFGFFLLGIVLTASKAALFALLAGLLFYLMFYPSKKLKWFKIGFLVFFIISITGLFVLSSQDKISEKIKDNPIIGNTYHRISSVPKNILNIEKFSISNIGSAIFGDRFSSWIISTKAIKEKPVFGYGPENFSIPFDKYYDNSLLGLEKGDQWWDRAHNFIFDIAVTTGLPALIIFVCFFVLLFLKLQKLKKQKENKIIIHGLQASIIVYLANNLFGFDTFSTNLIIFFIIGYSLSLTNKKPESINLAKDTVAVEEKKEINPFLSIVKIIIFIMFFSLIWIGGLKPLWINKEINVALLELGSKKEEQALKRMENILTKNSVIKNYTNLQYFEMINNITSSNENLNQQTKMTLAKKEIKTLKEASELRPNYTRTWWALNICLNYLLGSNTKTEEIINDAIISCEKAKQLGPNRWQIRKDCIGTYILIEDFEKAEENFKECVSIDESKGICWFRMGLINLSLGEIEQAEENFKKAEERGYSAEKDASALFQITEYYNKFLGNNKDKNTKNYVYKKLIKIYEQAIMYYFEEHEEQNPQYHSSLAYLYKEIGEQKKAEEQAKIVLKLLPEKEESVEEFLKNI